MASSAGAILSKTFPIGALAWYTGCIAYETLQLTRTYQNWTQNKNCSTAQKASLLLRGAISCSNLASSSMSFYSVYFDEAATKRLSNFFDAWAHSEEYLGKGAKEFVIDYATNVLEINGLRKEPLEREAEQIVSSWKGSLQEYKPIYEMFLKFIKLEKQKTIQSITKKFALFSLIACLGQYLLEKGFSNRPSKTFVYEVLEYTSNILNSYLSINYLGKRTTSLAMETLQKVIGYSPMIIRSMICCEIVYPIIQSVFILNSPRPDQPLRIDTFVLIKYTFPSPLEDPSLDYVQIPDRYHDHEPFREWRCQLENKPLTKALIIAQTGKAYTFEKATLVRYVSKQTRENKPLVNPATNKPFTSEEVYIDPAFDERLAQRFLRFMTQESEISNLEKNG